MVVVGGGHNGLTAAFYLARAGRRVLVLERRPFVGGACATEELFDGYRFSSCSYVCWFLQRKVVDDMQLARHGFVGRKADPIVVHLDHDRHLSEWLDDDRTTAEFAAINSRDADRRPAFEDFWARSSDIFEPLLLRRPPSIDFLRRRAAELGHREVLERLLSESVGEITESFFEDPLVQSSSVILNDSGGPWDRGNALSDALFRCASRTGWDATIVQGGMGALSEAMASAATAVGAEIRTGAEVAAITIDAGQVRGVELTDGSTFKAPIVLSNADPKRTFLGLIEAKQLDGRFRKQVEGLANNISCLKFHAVMREPLDLSRYESQRPGPAQAAHLRIGGSLEQFDRAYRQTVVHEPADEPICHIQVPGRYDSTLTDGAGLVLSIWTMYAPGVLAEGSWETRRAEVGAHLIDYVTEFIPNFKLAIESWTLFTPADLEARVGLTAGNIRHLDNVAGQLLDSRPLPGAEYGTPIEGLYLCGAGTHPGGEVTGAPGHNAAHYVLDGIRDSQARQPLTQARASE